MKKNIYIIIMVLFMSASSSASLCGEPDRADLNPIVRVAILDDRTSVRLYAKKDYRISTADSLRLLMEGHGLEVVVTSAKSGLKIGKRETNSFGFRVTTAGASGIYVDSRCFRGDIEIVQKESGKIRVINRVPLEEYLYGVLYHEVSHRWPQEVLKAQAIAARTFALYQMQQNKAQPYDLRSDIYSQVYGGSVSERWTTTKAVDATAGRILLFDGKILPAYYHATCAGRTEDSSNLWTTEMLPLKGVVCGFCVNSPHYKWKKLVPLPDLEKKLTGKGYAAGKINLVKILSKNISGRVDKLEIKGQSGVVFVLTGKEFRQLIGPNDIRSTRFDISIRRGQLEVSGFGWGHGVGMCQWGAFGMARNGAKAEDILKYYYPGAEISTIEEFKGKL